MDFLPHSGSPYPTARHYPHDHAHARSQSEKPQAASSRRPQDYDLSPDYPPPPRMQGMRPCPSPGMRSRSANPRGNPFQGSAYLDHDDGYSAHRRPSPMSDPRGMRYPDRGGPPRGYRTRPDPRLMYDPRDPRARPNGPGRPPYSGPRPDYDRRPRPDGKPPPDRGPYSEPRPDHDPRHFPERGPSSYAYREDEFRHRGPPQNYPGRNQSFDDPPRSFTPFSTRSEGNRKAGADKFKRMEKDLEDLPSDLLLDDFHIPDRANTSLGMSIIRDPRPKIQVKIPNAPSPRRTPSIGHVTNLMHREKPQVRTRRESTELSPPSTNNRNMANSTSDDTVSPLSAVEMPKPRRPFSALSLEERTQRLPSSKLNQSQAPSHTQGKITEAAFSPNRANFSPLTKRLSATELRTESIKPKKTRGLNRRHSIAYSVIDPVAAGVFTGLNQVPALPKMINPAKAAVIDTNKPLPPPPPPKDTPVPSRMRSGGSFSSGSILHPRRKAPTPLDMSHVSVTEDIAFPGKTGSPRSKYTPADLDAMDASFMRTTPSAAKYHERNAVWDKSPNRRGDQNKGQSRDECHSIMVPLAFEDSFATTRSQSAMGMSRASPGPLTAKSIAKSTDGMNSRRPALSASPQRGFPRSKSDRNSIVTNDRRRTSFLGDDLPKPSKFGGKMSDEERTARMERQDSIESGWLSTSTARSYGDSSSPNMSLRNGTMTPETDVSSLHDYAFDDRARNQLASPEKHAPHTRNNRPRYGGESNAIVEAEDSPLLDTYYTGLDDDSNHGYGTRSSKESDRIRSVASIAMSEIHDLYADLPTPRTPAMQNFHERRSICAQTAEQVLLRILSHVDNLQDLFATAMVSRGFYSTFKRNELQLLKNSLYGMSPAAWELREVTPPYPGLHGSGETSPGLDYTPSVYLQQYMRDMYTMIALKSMILIHCESFLRPDTIIALAGSKSLRASQIDDAFWRVWTFCQIFGCGSDREDDFGAQLDWLRGSSTARTDREPCSGDMIRPLPGIKGPLRTFGFGNAGGLTANELYDMTEIWNCFTALVKGFRGKRIEAWDHGVFDKARDLRRGDVKAEDAMLEEWTFHLLTLAPPALLDVTSPSTPTAATFAHARARGYTKWKPPPTTRAQFLREALSKVYQERMAERHKYSPSLTMSPEPQYQIGSPYSNVSSPDPAAARWQQARQMTAASREKPNNSHKYVTSPLSQGAPFEEPLLTLAPTRFVAPSNSSRAGKSKFPPRPQPSQSSSYVHPDLDTTKEVVSALVLPQGPQVRDPADVAVEKLVQLGFEPARARKALADSDTGNSINFEIARERLIKERQQDVSGMMHSRYRGRFDDADSSYAPHQYASSSTTASSSRFGDYPSLRPLQYKAEPTASSMGNYRPGQDRGLGLSY